MKYKIIAEYDKFYLCEYETKRGSYRICFDKKRYQPVDGYIIIRKNEELKVAI